MWDKLGSQCGKARDLNRVFLQLEDISVRVEAQTLTRDVKMVGAKSAIPKREVVSKTRDETPERTRGAVG